MSIEVSDETNSLSMIDYLKDISNHLRLLNARIEDGFNTDINLNDINTLDKEQENGD